MRSALFSLAAILLFAKEAENRVCVSRACPSNCKTPTPYKSKGPCPKGSKELNEIAPTDDQDSSQMRRCMKNRRHRCRRGCGKRVSSFKWKGPCPSGYREWGIRVCKIRRCRGGNRKCTRARKGRCHRRTESEISFEDQNQKKQIRNCKIKSCSRRCQVGVRGFCPRNTEVKGIQIPVGQLPGSGTGGSVEPVRIRRINGGANGNDYEAGLLGTANGNDYSADYYEAGDFEADAFGADDYKADDYEADDYEVNDYEADEYEADDYEGNDYKGK